MEKNWIPLMQCSFVAWDGHCYETQLTHENCLTQAKERKVRLERLLSLSARASSFWGGLQDDGVAFVAGNGSVESLKVVGPAHGDA